MISFYKIKNKQEKQRYLKAGKLSYKHRKKFLNTNQNIFKLNKILKLRQLNYSKFKYKIHSLNILLNSKFQYLLLNPFIFKLIFNINNISNKLILEKLFNLINF
uniref:50S ribosomal protein L20 n=1 Tax=Nephromyces sp. ex Molgula occidentalis TaxID=2544991 RepID=A0A5C1HAC5_9APIC|nr:hypothetical protein [Nephromyces sp. ex Molgula occidentalis]